MLKKILIIFILFSNLSLATASNYDNSSRWDSSFSYGVGLEYWIPLDVSIQLNYMNYSNNLNGVEFGFGLKF